MDDFGGLGNIDFGSNDSMFNPINMAGLDTSGITPNDGMSNPITSNGISDSGSTPMSSVGGINWGGVASGVGNGVGAYLNNKANTNAQDTLGQGLQSMFTQVDPFSASRPQYVNQLNDFMSNPSQFLNTPYAQGVLNAGTQAVDRSQAAKGYLGSGNEAIALQQQGQTAASGLMQQQFSNLYNLSGAGVGQIAGADVLGNIAGLNAAKQTNQASGYNQATGYNPSTGASTGGSSGGGIGGTLGTVAGSLFGGPAGGAIGGALGSLLGGLF